MSTAFSTPEIKGTALRKYNHQSEKEFKIKELNLIIVIT